MKKLIIAALMMAGCNSVKTEKRTMCSYVIPDGYQLMTDTGKGKYAIKWKTAYLRECDMFFVEKVYGMMPIPTLYDDSCQAKEGLHNYFIERGATLTPVNPTHKP